MPYFLPVHHKRNRHGRKSSSHQRQMRNFAIFLGGLAVLAAVGVIWFLSRLHVPASPAN